MSPASFFVRPDVYFFFRGLEPVLGADTLCERMKDGREKVEQASHSKDVGGGSGGEGRKPPHAGA